MKARRFEFQQKERGNLGFVGRNGKGLCHGVLITAVEHPNPHVVLTPVNSKGVPSTSCNFDIPTDPSTLRGVARFLNEIADDNDTAGKNMSVKDIGGEANGS